MDQDSIVVRSGSKIGLALCVSDALTEIKFLSCIAGKASCQLTPQDLFQLEIKPS